MFWETQAGWRNSFVSQKLSALVRQTCAVYVEHYSDCHNSRPFLFVFFCMTLTSCSQPCIVHHFSTSTSSPFPALSKKKKYIYICIFPFTNCLPILSLSFRVVHDHPLFPPSIVSAAVIAFSFFFFLCLRSCLPFRFFFPLPKRQRVLYVVSFCLTAQTTLLLLLCFFFNPLSRVSAPVCVASLQLHSHTTFLYLFGFAS